MAKLYPPGLDGILPAFTSYDSVKIPFIPNKAVAHNSSSIASIQALVKNLSGTKILGILESQKISYTDSIVSFDFTSIAQLLKRGQSYKIQLAYLDSTGEVGYYSTVGIIKYTYTPTLTMNLEQDVYNTPLTRYFGIYTNVGDPTEKVYSYRFIVKDFNNNICEDTGELIHNHDSDTEAYMSQDDFVCSKKMVTNRTYKIQYFVTTTNGIQAFSPEYKLQYVETEPMEANIKLEVELNQENAYMSVSLSHKTVPDLETSVDGKFIITRACSKDNFQNWYELQRTYIDDGIINSGTEIFRDYTIEHGYSYKYGIQQYNNYDYTTNREETAPIPAKFEYSFLYDGEKQLKIKFDPKISNFKTVLQENKTNTMGSKFPFIFRNAHVGYKEFTINGLISYLSDEEQLFMTEAELFSEEFQRKGEIIPVDSFYTETNQIYISGLTNLDNDDTPIGLRNTSLQDANFKAERLFRDAVLEFLNNGKPKIFKSPSEGNFIVYLMNNSLTPKDELGRLLYSFTSSASEIMEYTWENLVSYNFVNIQPVKVNQWYWKTIPTYGFQELSDHGVTAKDDFITVNGVKYFKIKFNYDVYSVDIREAKPGTRYIINGDPIRIGVSGNYSVEFNKPIEYIGVEISVTTGWLTIRYTRETFNEFNMEKGMNIRKVPTIQQFIGKRKPLEELDNTWEELSAITYFKFSRRQVITLYVKREDLITNELGQRVFRDKEIYYQDRQCEIRFTDDFNASFVYEIKSISNITDDNINILEFKTLSKLKLLDELEKIEFYIDVSQQNKTFPRKSYIYKAVDFYTVYNPNIYYQIKLEYENKWLIEGEDVDKNWYIRAKNNPLYQIFQRCEVFQEDYVQRLDIKTEDSWAANTYYVWDSNKQEFIKDTENFNINQIYYEKGIPETQPIFYAEKDYSDFYWYKDSEGKIFISPNQFNFEARVGINVPVKIEGDIVTTEKEFLLETLDLEKDIIISGKQFRDLAEITIGWGVCCEIVYNLRRRKYGFYGKDAPVYGPYKEYEPEILKDHNPLRDYIKYINWLNDEIYFYRFGNNGGAS